MSDRLKPGTDLNHLTTSGTHSSLKQRADLADAAVNWNMKLARHVVEQRNTIRQELVEALSMAVLWKKTARHAVRDYRLAARQRDLLREALTAAKHTPEETPGTRVHRLVRANHVLRAERDEALRTLKEALDSHDETLRDIAAGKYTAEPHPLAPDDVRRALDVAVESFTSSCPPVDEPYTAWKVRQTAWEALRELFPDVPQSAAARPEGPEEIEGLITYHYDDMPAETLTALSDALAERYKRVEGGAR